MKFKLLLSLLMLILAGICIAQTVSNIRAELVSPAGYYIISFDLSGKADELYMVKVTPYVGNKEVSNPRFAAGDGIDEAVKAGKNLQIYWHPGLEGQSQGNWQFRISTSKLPKNMIIVEGGSFSMGPNDGESDEKPIHQVTVTSFMIGKYQVTQKEWNEVMGSNPSYWKGNDLPVECVTWYEAIEYCNKRSSNEGLTPCYSGSGDNITCNWNANGYRLPTEAEWEYAARGGNKSKGYKYSGSNDLGSVAWYDGNSGNKTHTVGSKAPNELGLYDMSGNVWEWCWDWYGGYSSSPANNPTGPTSGSGRVLRGGGWDYGATGCRVAYRDYDNPYGAHSFNGFRLCRAGL